MYGYIYLTTNLVNNSRYVGRKKSDRFPFINKNGEVYLGSGMTLNKAINKYGRENFKVELLEEAESAEELYQLEEYWIDKLGTYRNPYDYNWSPGGKYDGFLCGKENIVSNPVIKERLSNSLKGRKMSDEARKNMSIAGKGRIFSEEHRRKIGEATRGRKVSRETRKKISENHADFSGSNNPMYGKKRYLSEETRRKLSISQRKRFEDPNERLKMNTMKNASKETLDKLSKATSKRNLGRVWIYKDDITKFVDKSELNHYFSEGFRLGRGKSAIYSQINGCGRHWINNGECNKFVKDDEIDYYLSNGFVKGKLKKSK